MFFDKLMQVLDSAIPAPRKVELARRETEKLAVAEEELERQRILTLHKRYIRWQEDYKQEDLTAFSNEETIDLSTANRNKLIIDKPFCGLYITQLTPALGETKSPVAYIRVNSIASSVYQVRTGYLKGKFNKVFLTNTVQNSANFKFVLSNDEDVDFGMLGVGDRQMEQIIGIGAGTNRKTLSDLYDQLDAGYQSSVQPGFMDSVEITTADTEYELTIPIYTKILKIGLSDMSAFRLAWETGKVAAPTMPAWSQPANTIFELNGLRLEGDKTCYVAAPVGTKIAVAHYSR